jgi:hypothetical protein
MAHYRIIYIDGAGDLGMPEIMECPDKTAKGTSYCGYTVASPRSGRANAL